ncbi:MAG: hypothetical protein ACXVBE_05245, partial [Bdellovibrionota bacterium]
LSWVTIAAMAILFAGLFIPRFSLGEGLTQVFSSNDAAERNRNASKLSNNAGRNSIGRGHHNHHHGKSMGAAGAPMMALGAMQVAQGMLGLMAAQKAADVSDKNAANAVKLSEVKSNSGASIAGASLDGGASVSNGVTGAALDRATLHSGELGEALGELQEQYGISPEELAQGLAQGIDPRLIFMHAPENSLNAQEANLAMKQAREIEASSLAEDIKNSSISAAVKDTTPAKPLAAADVKPAIAEKGSKDTWLRDSLRDKLRDRVPASSPEEGISPEIQAALQAKEAALAKTEQVPETLFDVVHSKYKERMMSMYPPSTN